ncbi:uncharacterized protein F4812DRAFT_457174 [Daldinia caldariorum]|uniref:uncharacterized protein n=1 Tax=Daldinia caldariorum TaxID=326644 RepID=UPI0020072326|nr:uncharacterized protein F4812DRAFT_457174 [Daldinia caldariorum]KAI1469773.1 hypothetical protein F4812DRAFT_457174 [Daldinia caldariorum]
MANKAAGHKKGSRENPIPIDDENTSKASSRRTQASKSKGNRSQENREPWLFGPTGEELLQPLAGPSNDDPFNTWKPHQSLRNGRLERRQYREESGLPSSDSEQYDGIYDKYSEEEVKPKKRGKKQTGPARKRAKHSPEPKVSSSKAMDHLTARVVYKNLRDD